MPKLRIGLTIAGAVSLGSYEGGALAALLLAVQRMKGDVVVDAITGASAGAITAVLSARCLARGVDPVDAMVKSWVELPSLSRLYYRSLESPLSGKVLGDEAVRLLSPTGLPDGPPAARQPEGIRVALTVVTLNGFQYKIRQLEKGTSVQAVTHLDWVDATFSAETPEAQWLSAAQAALASGANAVGFPPKLLKRSADDIKRMVDNGIQNPPTPDGTWYTDGGTINNEPFGRVLDLVADANHDDPRVLLLVHPHPSAMPGQTRWTDFLAQPRWTPTGARAKKLQGTQSIYDDLRRLEKTNTRLKEVQHLARKLEDAAVSVLEDADPQVAARLRSALVETLQSSLEEQHQRRVELHSMIGRAVSEFQPMAADTPLHDLLCAAVNGAAGLAGKKPTTVEIVSPALDPSGEPAEEILAGEKLGHFFGFLADRFRQSDFLAGYEHMCVFLADHLPQHGVKVPDDVMAELDQRKQALGWHRLQPDEATFKSLSFKERFRLAVLGTKIGRIVAKDVRKWNEGWPVTAGGD